MLIVAGDYVLTDPARGSVAHDSAVLVEGNRIREVAPLATLQARFPGAETLGGPGRLVMPGLIDAHSHGRGLSPIQKGVPYDYLENAFLDWSVDGLPAERSLRRPQRRPPSPHGLHRDPSHRLERRGAERHRRGAPRHRRLPPPAAFASPTRPPCATATASCRTSPASSPLLPADLADFIRPTLTYDADRRSNTDYFDQFEALREEYMRPGLDGHVPRAARTLLGARHHRALPRPRAGPRASAR